MAPAYTIKTPVFEGPLDLLLSLIEKRKLLINDIALAAVADDYLHYTKQLAEFPIAESADFILIASTLVLIKSKSLLPALALSEEEQGSIADLEARLRIYQRLRALATGVRTRYGRHVIFALAERPRPAVFSPPETLSLAVLASAVKDVLKNLPKKEFIPRAVIDKVISLEEVIDRLSTRIRDSLKMSFREFSLMGKESRVNVIVSFLAMLELVKQGIIDVIQTERFGDIDMETETLGVPNYNQ